MNILENKKSQRDYTCETLKVRRATMLLVYVDDIIVTSNDKKRCKNLKNVFCSNLTEKYFKV